MEPIFYIDRITGEQKKEKVYGETALKLFYGNTWLSSLLSFLFHPFISKLPLVSNLYGWLQSQPASRNKIEPFIKNFDVDPNEFLLPVSEYKTFNDFFIRELKPDARPIDDDPEIAIIPADGRYYFYQDIDKAPGFIVKGKKFSLEKLLQNDALAAKYRHGSMVLARLCPSDYHRFHFPCACIPGESKLINGYLYSVNPLAIKQNIEIFTENKRTICELETEAFGNVIFIDVGATNVGAIHQTYIPGQPQLKGSEKGYFSFGGSSLILLFEPNMITFDPDLIAATEEGLEIRCLMGQSMGHGTT